MSVGISLVQYIRAKELLAEAEQTADARRAAQLNTEALWLVIQSLEYQLNKERPQ